MTAVIDTLSQNASDELQKPDLEASRHVKRVYVTRVHEEQRVNDEVTHGGAARKIRVRHVRVWLKLSESPRGLERIPLFHNLTEHDIDCTIHHVSVSITAVDFTVRVGSLQMVAQVAPVLESHL